jgi:hypothetical protein
MKIAYLILAHQNPGLLGRLIGRLTSPNADFFVHVDKKSDITPFASIAERPNVFLLRERVAIYYGEFSMVRAELLLLRQANEQHHPLRLFRPHQRKRLPAAKRRLH